MKSKKSTPEYDSNGRIITSPFRDKSKKGRKKARRSKTPKYKIAKAFKNLY